MKIAYHLLRTAIVASLAAFALPLSAGDLSGKWAFTWDTEGGVRESVVEIKQDGEKLTGKMGEAELAGQTTAEGFELAGKLYSSEAGYTADLRFRGKQDGDKLVGTGAWDAHGVSFTAARTD